jgi:hypothetical protein
MKKIGAVILTIGAIITVFTALKFSFITSENAIDSGNFEINQRKRSSLPWTPIVGVAVMVIGGGIYLVGIKKPVLN